MWIDNPCSFPAILLNTYNKAATCWRLVLIPRRQFRAVIYTPCMQSHLRSIESTVLDLTTSATQAVPVSTWVDFPSSTWPLVIKLLASEYPHLFSSTSFLWPALPPSPSDPSSLRYAACPAPWKLLGSCPCDVSISP